MFPGGTGAHTRKWRQRHWPWIAGGVAVIVAAGVGVGVGVASGSSHSLTTKSAPTKSAANTPAQLTNAVTVSPANGAMATPPGTPVTVVAGRGRILSVVVTSATGQSLPGAVNPAGTGWLSSELTAPSSSYQVRTTVAGSRGVTATSTAAFSTVSAKAIVGATLFPSTGLSVGVGQPIVVKFDQPVTDATAQQSVLSHLHVSLSTPVALGAHWFSDTELHLRPQTYWPSGEQISVNVSLDGWNAGSGMWGEGTQAAQFSIGDSRISTANLATHEMTVTQNGQTVATYPLSGGSDQFPTMDGIHIVMDRENVVDMNSDTVGLPGAYNELVYWDVHISDSGEYVHAAPWSVGDQGNTNVSHGCINISPTDAQQFMNFSRVGDLVLVVGGPRPPVPGDHGVMDWQTDWSQWTPFTAS